MLVRHLFGRRARWAGGLILLVCCIGMPTPALALPYWPASPQSPQARSITSLFWIVIAIAFVFLFLVEGLLVYIMVRFRRHPGQAEPRQVHGNHRLELWWTAIPLCILVGIFVLTVQAVVAETSIAGNALPVTVIGHQWWWEFRYPTLNVVTANELHVPAGRAVRLELQSADVVHNFWFPTLAGKEELIPGKTNVWTFTPDRPGTYDGDCSEYCGTEHAWMRLKLVAQTPQDFDAWAAQQAAPATPGTGSNATAAVQLLAANTCTSCHTVRGTPASGTVGPDLTHVGGRTTLGAGVLENNLPNMERWLRNPQEVKPGSLMPNLHLTDEQAALLASYLEGLK